VPFLAQIQEIIRPDVEAFAAGMGHLLPPGRPEGVLTAPGARAIMVRERRIPGQKSLTNIVRIVSREWHCFYPRGENARIVPRRGGLRPTRDTGRRSG